MCGPFMTVRRTPPKAPTPPPAPKASPDEKRAALETHHFLQESLATLRNRLMGGSGDIADIDALLSTSAHHLDNLAHYLSATIEPTFYNETIPPHSTAAQRTFAIPELFEMVADYLPIPSILSFSQTCHEYKARIDNSSHLQTALCIKSAPPDSNLRVRFSTSVAHAPGGGFYCKPPVLRRGSVAKTADGESEIEVGAAFFPQGDEQRLPRIGSTYRKMLITQPPIKEITPRIRCCRDLRDPIVRETGITIGDLYDSAVETIEKHRWCPHEIHAAKMLENGQVKVLIEFVGKATLAPTDPMLKKYARDMAVREGEEKRYGLTRRRNWTYRSAKVVAHDNGQPIPTMPQWLEANPHWNEERNPEAAAPHESMTGQSVTIPIDAFSFN